MNLRPLVSSAVLALSSAVLFASGNVNEIRFSPPNPSPHTSVDAIVVGGSPDSCIPTPAGSSVSGSTITLHLNTEIPPGTGCLLSPMGFEFRFHLGVVPAGVYTVAAVGDQSGTSTELRRQNLIVRDDESLQILPYAVPTTGGQIGIGNPFYLAGATVTIGDKTVTANSSVDGLLFADAPPHAPGAVDVVVNSTNGQTRSAKAGVIYYDPAAADPAVFEPILFPLSFEGPGAFGSQWTTENIIEGSGSPAYFRDALPCQGCSGMLSTGQVKLANDGAPYGHVLYAMRGTTDGLTFASRIRDVSRQAQNAGTEVPVVRESDFRARRLRFLNVPADARYRTMLRVWTTERRFLGAGADSIPARSVTVDLTPVPGTGLWFGSADVTDILQQSGRNPSAITLYTSGYGTQTMALWGMLSITNNDTQQVTIVTPH